MIRIVYAAWSDTYVRGQGMGLGAQNEMVLLAARIPSVRGLQILLWNNVDNQVQSITIYLKAYNPRDAQRTPRSRWTRWLQFDR